MTLGSHEKRRRRQRGSRWGLARWAIALAAVVAVAMFAYDLGSRQNSHQVSELRAQVDDLFLRLQALQQQNIDLQASMIVVEERMRDAQRQVVEGVPSCDDPPATKRFMVQTPLSAAVNDAVDFADGAITVTALGATMIDAQGKSEAWFDPAQPVTLKFWRYDGPPTEVSGTLPLHAAVIVGDSEHRFSAVSGPQGFIQITGARCRLP